MYEQQIFELLLRRGQKVAPQMTIYNDTSALMDLDSGNILLLDGKPYLLRRNKIESGFGMDRDPKYSVKTTINLKRVRPVSSKIMEFAREYKADIILLYKHNKEKSEEFLFGNTAIQLVRKADIPVVVVKGEKGQSIQS